MFGIICLYDNLKKKTPRNPTATFHALNIPYVKTSPQKIRQQPLPSDAEQEGTTLSFINPPNCF